MPHIQHYKLEPCHVVPKFGLERYPVCLRFPWLRSIFTRFEMQLKSVVKQCFSAVEPRVVYSTNKLLSATNKDVLPALQKSDVIYQFSFYCDSRYVGRTSQRLLGRIKQHVSKSIRSCFSQKRIFSARQCNFSTQFNTQSLASDSAIRLHLLQNPACAQHYDNSKFSFLAQGRSPFHLCALEATFIKTFNLVFRRQKQFVCSLKIVLMTLSHWSFSS